MALPRLSRWLVGVGENIKKARLHRSYCAETQRSGITRKTLYRLERGDGAVSLGIYARVLQALRLEGKLGTIAARRRTRAEAAGCGVEAEARRAPRQRPEGPA
jgi:hypothetical protein